MTNKEFFDWMYERLIYVYKEKPNLDFVQSFKKRADWLIQNTIGWVSVKDRLPEENKWVFVCVDMQGVPQCVGLGYLRDGEWCDDENDNGFCVDYWMEIPKLPE